MIKVHYLPLATGCVLIVGFTLTYTVSVLNGHVYCFFPFISDTGAEQPESGMFGFVLNITTALLLLCIYVRYKQIELVKNKLSLEFSNWWSTFGVITGILSCIGMNIVANFSELTMGLVHLSGAFMCFFAAIIYFLIQTKISYHFLNQSYGINKCVFIIRVCLSTMLVPLLVLHLWFGKLAVDEFRGEKLNYWTEKDGGFNFRIVSTFCEWLMGYSLLIYIMTFYYEFRKILCDNINMHLNTT